MSLDIDTILLETELDSIIQYAMAQVYESNNVPDMIELYEVTYET